MIHSLSAVLRCCFGGLLLLLLAAGQPARSQPAPDSSSSAADSSSAGWELRVCSDPNNLPYSDREQKGFENEIARLLAEEMGARVSYEWYPQRRGVIRRVLREGACDVLMGVPAAYEMVATSVPYYRSGFVFAYREGAPFEVQSLTDSTLRDLRIGVHVQEGEGLNPPAQILARQGLRQNLKGYSVYGNYDDANPLSPIIQGIVDDSIDVAVVWGPIAGYFAQHQSAASLKLVPAATPEEAAVPEERSAAPLAFSIAMGMRRGDDALRKDLSEAIIARWDDIRGVLRESGVPLLPLDKPTLDALSEGDEDDDD